MKSKEIQSKIREKREEIIKKLKSALPKYPDSLPQNMKLFDHIQKMNANQKTSKEKGPHFGLAGRFVKSEKEIWEKQVKLFNKNSSKSKIDLKRGPKPGPGEYNLIERWKGKQIKRKQDQRSYSAQPKVGERLFKVVSNHLPTRSIYYPRNM